MQRNLQETLQALYDSEINVTITMLWDGGFDFALCSYMDPDYDDLTSPKWHNVRTAAELADGLHDAAMKEYETSAYAKNHSGPPRRTEGEHDKILRWPARLNPTTF